MSGQKVTEDLEAFLHENFVIIIGVVLNRAVC